MKTQKRIAVSLVVLLALLMAATPVFAADAHFIKGSASLDSSGNLIVSWKEAGLGNDATINYVASANGSATYACINGGGNHPQASNKVTVDGPVSATGTFSSGKNGDIVGSLTINPPSAGSFSCPSGQRLVLASVSYWNISITDLTNSITLDIAGVFSKIFFNV